MMMFEYCMPSLAIGLWRLSSLPRAAALLCFFLSLPGLAWSAGRGAGLAGCEGNVRDLVSAYATLAQGLTQEIRRADKANATLMAKAQQLVELSDSILQGARSPLPQCAEYLDAARGLSGQLDSISSAQLEQDYHRDGALPKAASECYHVKDLFVHAAEVRVLLREDTQLGGATKLRAGAALIEALGHVNAVQLSLTNPL